MRSTRSSSTCPARAQALDFLASKQRKSAVCLLLATQRAVIAALGGGMVRANMSEVLVGMVVRATESRHATGAEKEIPDIREYAKGAPGYFQRWDPHSGTVTGRGRAFLLGKPPDELAYMKRIVAARRHLRDWSIPDMPPLALDGGQAAAAAVTDATAQQIAGMRGRLASIAQAAAQPRRQPPPRRPRHRPRPSGFPRASRRRPARSSWSSWRLPGGTSASAAGLAIGKSKTVALEYLRPCSATGASPSQTGGGPVDPVAPHRPPPRPARRRNDAPAPRRRTSPWRPSPTWCTTAWSTSTTTPGRCWNRPARSGTGSGPAGRT